MTKTFEEEFNYLIELSGKVLIGQVDAEVFEQNIIAFFEKYETDKHQPLPEVPEFVADEICSRRYVASSSGITPSDGLLLMEVFRDLNSSHDIIRNGISFKEGKFYQWMQFSDNNKIFVEAVLNGYTVQKPKRFYLKNKLTTSYLELDKTNDYFHHTMNPAPYYDMTRKSQFTQEEIDSMNTGSYEKIEVEK